MLDKEKAKQIRNLARDMRGEADARRRERARYLPEKVNGDFPTLTRRELEERAGALEAIL